MDYGPIAILGERCSGTNVVEQWIRQNLRSSIVYPLGFKHFPDLNACLHRGFNEPLIIVTRNPVDWLVSFYRKPWHVPEHIANLSFSEFIRVPWYSVFDEAAGVNASDPCYNQKIAADLDPITGLCFQNVVEMRNAKNRVFKQMCESLTHVTFVRLEDLKSNQNETMAIAMGRVGIVVPRVVHAVLAYKGKASLKRRLAHLLRMQMFLPDPERKRPAPTVTDADRAFIWSECDLLVEAFFGYGP